MVDDDRTHYDILGIEPGASKSEIKQAYQEGLQAADGYPYFSVDCAYCVRRHAAGDRNGHGVGLCQEGAAGMAGERGASFADILQHYFPGTTLEMRSPR